MNFSSEFLTENFNLFYKKIYSFLTNIYFLTVRKIIRFDFADKLKIVGLRYICTI